MPKAPDSPPSESSDLAFEDALSQLEELIRGMESDQMPLEELITNYEKGTKLYEICEKRLNEAEGRIETIRKNRNGESVVEPLDEREATTAPSPEAGPASETEENEDNGELF